MKKFFDELMEELSNTVIMVGVVLAAVGTVIGFDS